MFEWIGYCLCMKWQVWIYCWQFHTTFYLNSLGALTNILNLSSINYVCRVWAISLYLNYRKNIMEVNKTVSYGTRVVKLTFCWASVSALRSTFSAYTSPVCFSRTTCTSPKCPLPMVFFMLKSLTPILRPRRSLIVFASGKHLPHTNVLMYK